MGVGTKSSNLLGMNIHDAASAAKLVISAAIVDRLDAILP